MSAYVLGRLSRRHLLGLAASGGQGIIMASIVGSAARHGGRRDMLSLLYVLERDTSLLCRLTLRGVLVLRRFEMSVSRGRSGVGAE